MKLTDIMKPNSVSRFVSYNGGLFLYITDNGFKFTIPATDLGPATLLAEDKTIMFMRYIRQQLELMQVVKNQVEAPISKEICYADRSLG